MLHITSQLFLTNCYHALLKETYFYSVAFFSLAVTSYFQHTLHTDVTYWIDQAALWTVISTGGYYLFTHLSLVNYFIPVICFVYSGILYKYGKMNQCFCFDSNEEIALVSHTLLHLVSSLGHHMILTSL